MFDTREKKERSLGTKLFLKKDRCSSPKCVTVRRPHPPGMHGKRKSRRTASEFSQQLKEKQKIKFSYGLKESQMKNLFFKAIKNAGDTGVNVLQLLERRLDNVVFRLGFAPSRSVARQLVGHGHILVNGRKITAPSYRVAVGNKITIRPASRNHPIFKDLSLTLNKYEPPVWLNLDKEKIEGVMVGVPKDLETSFDVNMVVDYYSK
jgi:small subunit ribosomal protein S4